MRGLEAHSPSATEPAAHGPLDGGARTRVRLEAVAQATRPEGVDDIQTEDAQLVARIGAGDQAALEVLYDRYAAAAFGLAQRVCGGNRTIAEDVVQEAFLTLWRNPQAYRPERGRLSSYLLGVVHHRAVDAVRHEESVHRRERAIAEEGEIVSRDDPVEAAWASACRRQVRSAIAQLSAVQREAIVLAYFGGLTVREVAERLAIPLGTAKTRIRDGMLKLRVLLAEAALR